MKILLEDEGFITNLLNSKMIFSLHVNMENITVNTIPRLFDVSIKVAIHEK